MEINVEVIENKYPEDTVVIIKDAHTNKTLFIATNKQIWDNDVDYLKTTKQGWRKRVHEVFKSKGIKYLYFLLLEKNKLIYAIIYLAIGFASSCFYVWQLGGPDSIGFKDWVMVTVIWTLLWPYYDTLFIIELLQS